MEGPAIPIQISISSTPAAPVRVKSGAVQMQVVISAFDGVDRVEFSVEGQPYAEMSSPYTYTWDATPRPEGVYSFRARARSRNVWFESDALQVTVDRTPPSVVSVSPAPGATAMGNDPIVVTFSEPMAIQYGPITFEPPPARVLRKSLGTWVTCHAERVDGATVTLVPDVQFASPDELTVELRADLTDIARNTLAPTSPWVYSVDSPWKLIGGGPVGGTSTVLRRPSLFTMAGALHASTGVPESAVAKLSSDAWQPVTAMSNPPGALLGFGPETLGTDGSSIWILNNGPYRWNGTAWNQEAPPIAGQPPPPGSPLVESMFTAFRMLAGDYGLVAIWSESFYEGSRGYFGSTIRAARWNGTEWIQVAPLSSSGPYARVEDVVISGGVPHVVYNDGTLLTMQMDGSLYVARLDADRFVRLPGAMPSAGHPAAIAPDLTVAAVEGPDGKWINSYAPEASGWQETGLILPARAHQPAMVVTQTGARYIAELADPPDYILVFTWDGAKWVSPWGVLNMNPEMHASEPRIIVDPDGAIVVAWSEEVSPGGQYAVYAKRLQR